MLAIYGKLTKLHTTVYQEKGEKKKKLEYFSPIEDIGQLVNAMYHITFTNT